MTSYRPKTTIDPANKYATKPVNHASTMPHQKPNTHWSPAYDDNNTHHTRPISPDAKPTVSRQAMRLSPYSRASASRQTRQSRQSAGRRSAVRKTCAGSVQFADSYNVQMSVQYETKLGENLYVMGNISELGNWNDFVCKMTWTEGHIWVTNGLVIKSPFFQYKYVVKDSNMTDETIWEQGYDRIADLSILPDISAYKSNNQKTVELPD